MDFGLRRYATIGGAVEERRCGARMRDLVQARASKMPRAARFTIKGEVSLLGRGRAIGRRLARTKSRPANYANGGLGEVRPIRHLIASGTAAVMATTAIRFTNRLPVHRKSRGRFTAASNRGSVGRGRGRASYRRAL